MSPSFGFEVIFSSAGSLCQRGVGSVDVRHIGKAKTGYSISGTSRLLLPQFRGCSSITSFEQKGGKECHCCGTTSFYRSIRASFKPHFCTYMRIIIYHTFFDNFHFFLVVVKKWNASNELTSCVKTFSEAYNIRTSPAHYGTVGKTNQVGRSTRPVRKPPVGKVVAAGSSGELSPRNIKPT